MPNPLYNMLMGQQPGQKSSTPVFNNPMEKMNYIMQAMQNPAAFVRNAFPDIPEQIQNNPNQILQYLQRTRNISNQQIQQLMSQIPGPR